jgi:AcrR family transcriptional regulator
MAIEPAAVDNEEVADISGNVGTARSNRRSRAEHRYGRRRQEVLQAAIKLFSEQGYEATSLLEVAEAVGLLKGSLYYYARSKEDLLYAIISEFHDEGVRLLAELEGSAADPLAKMDTFIRSGVIYMLSHRAEGTIYFHDAKALNDQRQQILRRQRRQMRESLEGIIRSGQKQKLIRQSLDPRVVSIAVNGAVNWLAMAEPVGKNTKASYAKFADQYTELLMQSIVAAPKSL